MRSYFIPENFLKKLNIVNNFKNKGVLPKISIVMPSYNQVKFIERSILSVLNQDYPNIELIIIDGESKDGTTEIIQKYETYIAYWVSEQDEGQSDALNKGFKLCSGEIFGWLNSDDIYLPNAFTSAVQAFDKNPRKKIVFGDFLSIDREGCVLDYNHAFDFNLNQFKYEGFHLNAQSMFWRDSVHKSFSGFDINLKNTMDYQMIIEFGINEGQKSFFRIPQALGGFRRYDGQKTGGYPSRARNEHRIIAIRYKYSDKYKLIGKLKRLYFRFRRAWWYTKRGGLSNLFYRLKIAYVNYF